MATKLRKVYVDQSITVVSVSSNKKRAQILVRHGQERITRHVRHVGAWWEDREGSRYYFAVS